uniref:Copper amine oxidase-like N-terminal domain-containing protein n=1 Tax=uncultured Bacillota bacterium TaxID=344338 RepID=A0A650EQ35_9FIRM|nr:hypothetical protein Firmicute1046_1200 [uncultured Firmicutes bacterium]
MKKWLVCLTVVFCMGASMFSAFAADSTQIILNGELCEIPEGYGRVFVQDARTYVPVRFVTEQLGCAVTWDESDNLVVISTNDMSDFYILQSGSRFMLHQKIGMPASPRIEMDVEMYYDEAECRNYIPVRFLAEAMGYTVDWNQETETVSLTKAE